VTTKCFKCGAEVASEARFCGHCGTPVSDPDAGTLVLPFEAEDNLLQRLRLVLAGEYEVEGELGRGGMAVVFRAREVGLRRTVAIKVLPPDLGLTPRAVERFQREARMVADLDHPNIIPVYRVGQIGHILYIVMKFVDGRPLDALINDQGALPVPVVVYVLRAATHALAYAHDHGIVHRDIKGANLLVDRDGRVTVSDFGVALRAADVTLTADGAVIGTPPFMSPEQCSGQRAGPQSDQYSLGILGFQMLTGSVPFQAESLAGIMQHHFFTPVPDVRLVRDDVPTGLVDVLHVALAKEWAARFPSTRDMLAAINAIPFSEADQRESERVLRKLAQGDTVARISTRSLPALPDSPTLALSLDAVARARPVSRRGAWAAGTAAGVALAVGAAWWIGGATGTPVRRQTGDSAAAPTSQPPVTVPAAPVVSAPTGKLRMLTSPADAEILVDGRHIGVGSVLDVRVVAGSRRLRVRAPGYETLDTTIVIRAGETTSLGRIALRGRDGGA